MRIKRWGYSLIPLTYVVLIVIMLYLHYSYGESFRRSLGSVKINGTMMAQPDSDSPRLLRIVVELPGLRFYANDRHSPLLKEGEQRMHNLKLLSWKEHDSGYSISFSRGVTLTVTTTYDQPTGAHIGLAIEPEQLAQNSTLIFPLRVPLTGRWSAGDGPNETIVHYRGMDWLLTLPDGAIFDPQNRQIIINLYTPTVTMRYQRLATETQQMLEEWFGNEQYRISQYDFETRINDYMDGAYRGWRTERFNSASGTWKMRDGSTQFSEAILTACLCEAWLRDDYAATLIAMRRAADLNSDHVGLLSAPFLGELDRVRENFLIADRRQADDLLVQIRRGNADLFLIPSVVQFALDRGSPEHYKAILDYIHTLDLFALTVRQSIGLLANSMGDALPTEESRRQLARLQPIIVDRLLANLRYLETSAAGSVEGYDSVTGFFIRTDPGRVDVVQSVLAGKLLERIGKQFQQQRLITIGQNLIVSALDLQSPDGYLPQVLFISAGGLQDIIGSVGPEALYPILGQRDTCPHAVSLSERYGDSAWIWTTTPISALETSPREVSFVLHSVTDRTHFLILQGLPRPQAITILEQEWIDTPQFEDHNRGLHFIPGSQTLMIKYTASSDTGTVEISYQ